MYIDVDIDVSTDVDICMYMQNWRTHVYIDVLYIYIYTYTAYCICIWHVNIHLYIYYHRNVCTFTCVLISRHVCAHDVPHIYIQTSADLCLGVCVCNYQELQSRWPGKIPA